MDLISDFRSSPPQRDLAGTNSNQPGRTRSEDGEKPSSFSRDINFR
jgi:hypothetical protein